ncbi:MAG TPA: diacylglycerol kinase family protein [Myxococcales bacterium]|nr:diacylglycerol kinase family protein [Myxococcales bacterium]
MDSPVAVLLNANAKQVTGRVQGAISHVVPPEDIFLSKTKRDAKAIARAVLERRYGTVFIGGGDGTFVGFVNEICEAFDQPPALELLGRERPSLPRFGMLKLGTGNAVAGLVGASSVRGGGILDDLLRARSGEIPGTFKLDLLEVEGKRCPFAGFGIDAAIINDYAWLNRRYGSTPWRRLASGAAGYAAAIAGRTVPHYLTGRGMANVVVVNEGAKAQRVHRGLERIGEPVPRGGILYQGPCNVLAGSTVPCFGFNFKFFPFAGKVAGMMHLRISKLPTTGIIGNLPSIWKGKYDNTDVCWDYVCDRVSVKFDRAMPLEIGGDAEGYRETLSLGMAEQPVEMVSFKHDLLH